MDDKTQPIADDLFKREEPFALFADWFREAEAAESVDHNAMALSTVDAQGMPDVRIVLLKGFDQNGFVFYTNTESVKGDDLKNNPKAALCFFWKSLRRQVRVRGPVQPVPTGEADRYFASRPRGSQIGAWASHQSQPLNTRKDLEASITRLEKQFSDREVPRPPHWSGYRVMPLTIEFWLERPYRLHDRRIFRRDKPGASWAPERLYP